ncbi:hypothetical protein H310_15081 [Aphanomyces invadans]|uniref:Uncharacterized protein n=1 Tax=Aphanomyces invadans TaxID=157072 RepID=A0A024T811_9STRA|nr:hypothetical protein H310_15081 [Aphanomyces invadans]ETV90088.1 hypothetical protein H310_15081 [Aphanomyces invadans]|eukprot:XP_008881281.1 hypothetical protein H310_15081 [Aphanomyces invadans]
METLNANFVTLQSCLKEVIRCNGDNNYKIPHVGKSSLLSIGRLPDSIEVERDVYNAGCISLGEEDFDKRLEDLAEEVKEDLEMAELCTLLESLGLDNKF